MSKYHSVGFYILPFIIFASLASAKEGAPAKIKGKIDKPKPVATASVTPTELLGRLNDNGTVTCPTKPATVPEISRAAVYEATPYKAGEIAEYEVSYMGALVGTARMEVRPPVKQEIKERKEPSWLRAFHVDAATGDWYKLIFVAHDRVDSFVRPWDHGVNRFYIEQDEGKMFGQRFQQKKWLEFDHKDCKVNERTLKPGKPEKSEKFPFMHGAMDTLGIAYWMREQTYKINEKIRGMVYSSEKNWWLEAEPLAFESMKTKAGTFEAVKMKLQTFIGKDLQQKGDVVVYIAHKEKSRPIVAIKADIKLGSVWIEMSKFTAGR